MELKRVVVTGLGALTPIGNTVSEYWDGLVTGKSGANPIIIMAINNIPTLSLSSPKSVIVMYLNRRTVAVIVANTASPIPRFFI